MLRKILKLTAWIVALAVSIVAALLIFFNLPVETPAKKFNFGVTFSSRYAAEIKSDWKANYLAILDELKVKRIRIPLYWDKIEKENNKFEFSEIDWQVAEAEKRGTELILVVGRKVPRWPECYEPEWVRNQNAKIKNQNLLDYIEIAINRYKNNPVVKYWQVENEPFLPFGVCPSTDVNLLDKEITLVRKLDPGRKIIITDSGELSFWIPAAKRADIFGTTMYLNVHSAKFGYISYPIGPNFFKLKKWITEKLSGQKNVIIAELQGEPWLDEWTINASVEKQLENFNEQRLEQTVEFAKKTGINDIYLWGVEWWWWLKTEKDNSVLWEKAKEIFAE